MTNSTTLEIQCSECKTWFPSPEPMDVMEGNRVRCPECQEMINGDHNIRKTD
jgi:predicted Zn finger-like uncharacterized protein